MINISTAVKNSFAGKKIVVLGDMVADQFLHGTISRVSREAPVFILRHDETETIPGGAANAAANIAALGGQALLIGVAGDDENGKQLLTTLDGCGVNTSGVVISDSITTTTKVRVLAGQHYAARQQVIRIDYENKTELNNALRNQLAANFADASARADAIIVSDYGYGAASRNIFATAQAEAKKRDIPLLIDSRFQLQDFMGATSATPNQDEVETILGESFTNADCETLRERLGFRSMLITRGNRGMTIVQKDGPIVDLAAVGSTEPVDVTGAGDTVIAAYTLGLAAGLSFVEAARIANHAGGLVVMKKGTATVSAEELAASIDALEPNASEAAK